MRGRRAIVLVLLVVLAAVVMPVARASSGGYLLTRSNVIVAQEETGAGQESGGDGQESGARAKARTIRGPSPVQAPANPKRSKRPDPSGPIRWRVSSSSFCCSYWLRSDSSTGDWLDSGAEVASFR